MTLQPISHRRLAAKVAHWRQAQEAGTRADGRETPEATVYRQCANDIELILRDDVLEQPRR